MSDVVAQFVDQWRRERPDLDPDLDAMETLARIGRVMALGTRVIEATLARHGLRLAEFDVLASLRRIGAPYTTTPSRLTRALMLSPAGMTSRLDRLETAGLIERRGDPADRRSVLVALTDAGFDVIDAAVTDHVATEVQLLAGLTVPERRALDGALSALLRSFEATAADEGDGV